MISADDIREVEATVAKISDAELAVRDLAERCRRKGDTERAADLDVRASWQLEHAHRAVEGLFA